MPIHETSSDKPQPAIAGEHTAAGVAISGTSPEGRGVEGRSSKGVGVVGISEDYRGIEGRSTNEHAILGRSTKGSGVAGISEDGRGVIGRSTNEHGVFGESSNGAGVVGVSEGYRGVSGRSTSGQGVWGTSTSSIGVAGVSESSDGVRGTSDAGVGVKGTSKKSAGVWGASDTNEGVHAETASASTAALATYQTNADSTTAALYAKHAGKGPAAIFVGNVHVSGNLTTDGDIVLANADCAEDFDVVDADQVQPGTVMVLGAAGVLRRSERAYDRCVAGVVSGASAYRPGIVLDKRPTSDGDRLPIALLGKVYCRADAEPASIEVGDLLTTSPTPGHAMKATDPASAFGAVLGKALAPLADGRGLIPILVALQ